MTGAVRPTREDDDGEEPREIVPAEILEAAEKIGADDPESLIATFAAIYSRSFTGPLPPPEMLAAYKEAGDDVPERIVQAFEMQGEHRRYLEKAMVEGDNRRADRGQIMAFVLGLIVLIGSIVLIAIGKELYGLAGVIAAVVGLLGVFILGRTREDAERRARLDLVVPEAGDRPDPKE